MTRLELRNWRLVLRVLTGLAVVGGMVAIWHFRMRFEPAALQAAMAGSHYAVPLFILLHIAASLLFVPRTAFAIAAGLLFGLWWGMVWATAGAMAGATAGFFLARYLNAGLLRPEMVPKLSLLTERIERSGWRAVALLRLVPILPHTPANYALGLTQVSLGAYLGGTFISMLPSTVLFVDVGVAGGRVAGGSGNWLTPTLIGLAALGVTMILPKLPFLNGKRRAAETTGQTADRANG